jgi:hypothetical protein
VNIVAQPKQRLPLTAEKVDSVIDAVLQMPQVECPVKHYFAPGVCIREMFMPAGSLVIGHLHRFPDMNIMLTGRITLLKDDGSVAELRAPQTFIGNPNGRKIAYVHEDCIWQNVFPTEERDVEKVEDLFLDKSNKSFQLAEEARMKLLPPPSGKAAKHPLEDILEDADFPYGELRIAIVRGRVFAMDRIKAGHIVAVAQVTDLGVTPAGRSVGHSDIPNSVLVRDRSGSGVFLIAVRDIISASGGFRGEEITIDYRKEIL